MSAPFSSVKVAIVSEQMTRTALAEVGSLDVSAHELGEPVRRERLPEVCQEEYRVDRRIATQDEPGTHLFEPALGP